MKKLIRPFILLAGLGLMLFGLSGCDSAGYPTSSSMHVSYGYYGGGYYDPWYRYPYYGGGTIIVNPPASRPPVDRPRPTPLPSMPTGPRPTPRR